MKLRKKQWEKQKKKNQKWCEIGSVKEEVGSEGRVNCIEKSEQLFVEKMM